VIHKSNFTSLMDCKKEDKKELDLLVKLIRVFDKDELSLDVVMRDPSCPEGTVWSITIMK
jgi:hypothetical protein